MDSPELNEAQWLEPMCAGDVQVGSCFLIKGRPCKIVEASFSKPGKHGHAKCTMTGVDLITGKKLLDMQPNHARVLKVHIQKKEYTLKQYDEDEKQVMLLSADGQETAFLLAGKHREDRLKELQQAQDDKNDRGNLRVIVTMLTAPEMNGKRFAVKETVYSVRTDKDHVK